MQLALPHRTPITHTPVPLANARNRTTTVVIFHHIQLPPIEICAIGSLMRMMRCQQTSITSWIATALRCVRLRRQRVHCGSASRPRQG